MSLGDVAIDTRSTRQELDSALFSVQDAWHPSTQEQQDPHVDGTLGHVNHVCKFQIVPYLFGDGLGELNVGCRYFVSISRLARRGGLGSTRANTLCCTAFVASFILVLCGRR